jgi:hypothetical protein
MVMLKARRCQRCGSSSCLTALCLLRVRGASSIRYWLGSTTSSLTSALTFSTLYTQPFGSDGGINPEALRNDFGDFSAVVVGWRNRRGIFIVFKGVEESSCQRCGLRTIEVKPRHAVGRNGSLHWESRLGRWEFEGWVGDDWSVPMAVLILFSASSTSSEIMLGGRAIGMRPASMCRCCRSSQRRLRSSSCSQFQARACLTPLPFGRGERNSNRFAGLVSGTLAVRCEWVLRFAKRCPTWTRIMWMQPLMT